LKSISKEENVNIALVAKMAQVSQTTVSRVLNNSPLVKKETETRVREVINELGYAPSELARSLRINETKTVGVIISNIMGSFYTAVVRGIEDVASKRNYSIILCNTDDDPEKERRYLKELISRKVDGLIVSSAYMGADYYNIVGDQKIVFFDRRPNGDIQSKYDIVLVQNREGSRQAVTHLIEKGYKRIGIINGSVDSTTGRERLRGYEIALEENGMTVEPELIKTGDFLASNTYEDVMDLLVNQHCDALFATNDLILWGVLKAARALNKKIPEELGIVAFDDMEWRQFSNPRITSVKQPTYEIGATAMNLLLERIAGDMGDSREVILPVGLEIRESTLKGV